MRNLFSYLICILFLCRCAHNEKIKEPLSSNNFRDNIKYSILTNYYSATYTGLDEGCFPKDVTNTCFNYPKNNYELKIKEKLKLKTLKISVDSKNLSSLALNRDYLFLAAGEISIQLGYRYIMHYKEQSYEGCSGDPVAVTTYQKSGGTVTANTQIEDNTYCLSSRSYYFVMFNDYKEITNGIVSIVYNKVVPFFELYGHGKNLSNHKNVFTVTSNTSENGVFFSSTKIAAWKKYLDSKALTKGLKEKLSVNEFEYKYNIEENIEEQPEKLEANPIEDASISVD